MEKITAVIPVKGHSSRLPGKNILPFAGTNLLTYKIRQLKCVKRIDEIIVSSDSEEMLTIALSEGVRIDRRPLKYADESQPFGYFLQYMCDVIKTGHLMWACCTSPLVDPSLYNKAIDCYFPSLAKGYDSLITVQKYQHFLLDQNGPMNFSRGLNHKNSQDLPVLYKFTCGIIMSPIASVREWYYHFGPHPYMLEVSSEEAIDIDTAYDYICAKAAYLERERRSKR